MSDSPVVQVHIDGAARGNPGPAAYAFIINGPGTQAVEDKGCLGSTTNNQAEYTALVRALHKAVELGAQRLLVHSDSELLVKQMNGEYRVKNEGLRALFNEAKELSRRFERVTFRHVPRAQNKRADELCNQALDGDAGTRADKPTRAGGAPVRRGAVPPARLQAAREEAIDCLKAALESWGRNDQRRPRPEDVWEQLWSVLEEHGLVSG